MATDVVTLPNDVKEKLLIIRDALILKDVDGAYHALYSIVDPEFTKYDPWECLQLGVEGDTSAKPYADKR